MTREAISRRSRGERQQPMLRPRGRGFSSTGGTNGKATSWNGDCRLPRQRTAVLARACCMRRRWRRRRSRHSASARQPDGHTDLGPQPRERRESRRWWLRSFHKRTTNQGCAVHSWICRTNVDNGAFTAGDLRHLGPRLRSLGSARRQQSKFQRRPRSHAECPVTTTRSNR